MKKNQKRRGFLKTGTAIGAGLLISNLGIAGESNTSQMSGGEMSIWDVFEKRRSVRKFKSTQVPEKHIEKIIDAARSAPTAGNQQPWKFLVIQDKSKIEELKKECIAKSMERARSKKDQTAEKLKEEEEKVNTYYGNYLSAPVYVIVLTDKESKYPSYNHHDGPLAAGYLILAARALGYGTVFCTDSIPEDITSKVFNISDKYERICITPIGIPEKWPESPEKMKWDEFVVNDSF